MIDIDRLERLYEKCGGVFKATVLIQKRITELNRGAKKLVEGEFKNPIDIAIKEIEENKIKLIDNTDENRELIRAEIERLTGRPAVPQAEVPVETAEDELERRIMSALAKERNA